ncbi:MAG: hypothetical protein IJT12_08550 [Paludibacteraceae bacterium]|nr:hypothetical protein [Paludibacteraceae bacterium]
MKHTWFILLIIGAAAFSGCSKDCNYFGGVPSPNTDSSTKQGGGRLDPNAYHKPLTPPKEMPPDALRDYQEQTVRVDETDCKE